jgi:deoxyribonuclease-4
MKFGAHVSIAGGIDKAPLRAHKLGCECFQIFTRSPRGGQPKPLGKDLVDPFLAACSEYGFSDYYIHTPYYINFSSDKKELRSSSIAIVRQELERSNVIGARYVMTHLGSAKDMPRAKAVRMVADGIFKVLDGADFSTELLLENTAGQGATIGDTFEELAEILDKVGDPGLGVCIDTAHLLASGYDIRTGQALQKTLDSLSATVGIDRVKLIHGNDSKVPLGERKDRHEHIGKGEIGKEGFKAILSRPELQNLNMIVETPPDKVGQDIKLLKRLRGRRQ